MGSPSARTLICPTNWPKEWPTYSSIRTHSSPTKSPLIKGRYAGGLVPLGVLNLNPADPAVTLGAAHGFFPDSDVLSI